MVSFNQADLNHFWPVAKQSFEMIVCNLVLEHIADLNFIFAQAAQALERNGYFFISELHPFKQYQGKQALFIQNDETTAITAFVHHISDYLRAAAENGFALETLREWWHEKDENLPPRLVSFLFVKK
jgi:malonyl-CoA O-methyltransferase